MSDVPAALRGRLDCQCQLCALWRRLGGVISAGHESERFHFQAKNLLRGAFHDLLDVSGEHHFGPVSPVAAGAVGPFGPPPLRGLLPGSEDLVGVTPAKKEASEGGGKRDLPRSREKKSGKEKDRSKRRRKGPDSEKKKAKEEQQSEAESKHPAESTASSKKSAKPSSWKEEDKHEDKRPVSPASWGDLEEDEEEPREERRERSRQKDRERSPVRGERGKEKKTRGEGAEPREPPGQWTLKPRPPSTPPPGRVPEPRHPPSWYYRDRERPSSRSKGIKRDVRNADIHDHGYSDERKKLREGKSR